MAKRREILMYILMYLLITDWFTADVSYVFSDHTGV